MRRHFLKSLMLAVNALTFLTYLALSVKSLFYSVDCCFSVKNYSIFLYFTRIALGKLNESKLCRTSDK